MKWGWISELIGKAEIIYITQKTWQWAKHAWLYSDLLLTLWEDHFKVWGFTKRDLTSASSVPHQVHCDLLITELVPLYAACDAMIQWRRRRMANSKDMLQEAKARYIYHRVETNSNDPYKIPRTKSKRSWSLNPKINILPMLNHISIGSYFILGNILILLIILTFPPFFKIFLYILQLTCPPLWN